MLQRSMLTPVWSKKSRSVNEQMEMDSTYDTKGSGDNLNQGDTLVEGYFWHDRTRSNYQDYPYYNQKGMISRKNSIFK